MNKLYFLVCLLLPGIGFPQNPGFIEAPAFYSTALGRDDASVFIIGNKAYVGLGTREDFSQGNDFYVFDALTDTWEPIASLPQIGRQYAGSFSCNGYGYIVGGVSGSDLLYNDVWQYGPVNNSWNQLQNFPGTPRKGMHTAVYGNNAYLFFGRDSANTLKDVWKYDALAGNWYQLPDFPSPNAPFYLGACVQNNDKVYMVSGLSDNGILTDETWEFDLQTETWTQLANFPGEPRWYGRGFSFGSKIYVGTGWGDSIYLNDFWSYDVLAQTWQPAPALPDIPKKGITAFNVNGRAFVGLGINQDFVRVKEFWEFVSHVGINGHQEGDIQIFPNPVSDFISIKNLVEHQTLNYSIIDISGKKMGEGTIQSQQPYITVDWLSSGFYYLLLVDGDFVCTQKFCVNRR